VQGTYQDLLPNDPDIYAFQRGQNALVVINLRSNRVQLPEMILKLIKERKAKIGSGDFERGTLSPWAVRVFG
jgi:hypothetical protein